MANDLIYEFVKNALIQNGWEIIYDPFIIKLDDAKFNIDLGAEKIIAASKSTTEIVVEIKSFNKISLMYDFYEAFGQYIFYRDALRDKSINKEIYLAISYVAWRRIQKIRFLLKQIERYQIKILVIDIYNQKIIEWKN